MPLFHLKFAVTIFIKVYSKMWGLWMHLDYDHFYIPLTSKQGKFQPQAIIFPVKKAYCCVVKISEKNNFFQFEILLLQPNKWKKTYFATKKYFKTLYDHCHCQYIPF